MIFAGGCEELDWTLSVLFDAMGAMSSKFNETPGKSSRAYDVDRDGFVIAGGAGVLVLEELEHAKARGAKIYGEIAGYGATSDGHDMVAPSGEGAVRCMKMALKGRQGAGRLHQSARHLDADRRPQGDRGDPRSVRRQMPADLGHQVADRPFARRRRRAGGDLFALDDAERLHLRERQYRESRSRFRRHADRARAAGQREARAACCRIRSASAAPTLPSCSNGWRLEGRRRCPRGNRAMRRMRYMQADARQARAGDGGGKRSLDRLGDCQDAGRSRRDACLHLSGRGARPACEAAGAVDRLVAGAALRRRGHCLGRCGVCYARREMGRARFSGSRRRVLRQERAEGPLRRHHAREFPAHHADLLLLLH